MESLLSQNFFNLYFWETAKSNLYYFVEHKIGLFSLLHDFLSKHSLMQFSILFTVMQPTLIETALPNVTRPLKQNIVNICCLRNKSVLRQLRIVESLMKKTTKTTSNYGGVTFNFNESLDAVVYFYNVSITFVRRAISCLI